MISLKEREGYRFKLRNHGHVGVTVRASVSKLGSDTILPFRMEGEEHQGPSGSDGGGLMARKVDALAVVNNEVFGRVIGSYIWVIGGGLHYQL